MLAFTITKLNLQLLHSDTSSSTDMARRCIAQLFKPRTPLALLTRAFIIVLPVIIVYVYSEYSRQSLMTQLEDAIAPSLQFFTIPKTPTSNTAPSEIVTPSPNTTSAPYTTQALSTTPAPNTTPALNTTPAPNTTPVPNTTPAPATTTPTTAPTTPTTAPTTPTFLISSTTSAPYIPPKNLEFSDEKPVINTFKIPSITDAKSTCPLPKLDLHDPAIMKFFLKYPRLVCEKDEDWITFHLGAFNITKAAARKYKNITCDLFPIVKDSDFKVVEGEPLRSVPIGTRIEHDFYRVYCTAGSGAIYNNLHAGVRYDENIQRRKPSTGMKGLDVDVIMIGLDSVSRLAWQRHLPLTQEYFVKILNGIEMEGYNIVGDGTPAALMPILTGNREEDMHEARRGYPGALPVDDFPWIWKDYRDAEYVTAWAEDAGYLGTFQFRLLGFTSQPTDHYYRYFSLAIEPKYSANKKYCLGSKPRHKLILDYLKELIFMYPKQRKWFKIFHSELSHEDNNLLSHMDVDIFELLRELYVDKHLDNAILIMLADHGARFTNVRATAQGKLEERLPYFGIRFPEWFHEKYPAIVQNVKNNTKRLTTPFDVHETLHEIIHFTGTERANITKRGVSMFKEIPEERDCNWAQVDPHWCACMDWTKVSLDDPVLKRVMKTIIDTFNNYTKPYRQECAVLKIKEILSANMMRVKEDVLRFRDTSDGGRGRFGKMDDTTEQTKILYQVIFTTNPGDGLFEATVTHHIKENKLDLNKHDISRTNKYGNACHCVEKKDPFLRPYCYCKDLIKS